MVGGKKLGGVNGRIDGFPGGWISSERISTLRTFIGLKSLKGEGPEKVMGNMDICTENIEAHHPKVQKA